MTLKDFSVGQTVYELKTDRPYSVTERKVKVVGRKYVTVDSVRGTKFCVEDYEPNALVESVDWGSRSRLFADMESLTLYQENIDCTKALRSYNNVIFKLPLEQKKQILKWIDKFQEGSN